MFPPPFQVMFEFKNTNMGNLAVTSPMWLVTSPCSFPKISAYLNLQIPCQYVTQSSHIFWSFATEFPNHTIVMGRV